MTVLWLGLLVSLAAFAAVYASAGVVARLTWRVLPACSLTKSPRGRARTLFVARLAPFGAAIAAASLVGLAFLAFEPPGSDEAAGLSLLALAGGGGALMGSMAERAVRAMLRSRELVQAWTRSAAVESLAQSGMEAWCIDSAFPLVAVVGLWRPRLIVARSVLESCTPAELTAIVAHERAHVAARDNLKRLCLHATADLSGRLSRGREMDRAWQDASEEAADEGALAAGTSRLDLASAMVTVARLSAGAPPGPLPASSAFYRGGSVERRVRRLLAEARPSPESPRAQAPPPRRRPFPAASGLAVLCAIVGTGLLLSGGTPFRAAYELSEWLVQTMP